MNPTEPSTLFGGTQKRIKDRFVLAAGDNYTSGATGGEVTHTLTVDEMPRHNHREMYWGDGSSSQFGVNSSGTGTQRFSYEPAASEPNFYTNYVGGGIAHNNMPPYLVAYMWYRTA